ncbi:type 2 isopentenyl-diphosphate Delta-isomerase [Pokkaliibacter sp. CJK22405]|uniref:type 2 isopentenyl-diphosphate Delta-isomerase n=1 Tax=Pokkaliibacter sp. CJK22405 TaxID=3384615 RepID=UPI003984FC25
MTDSTNDRKIEHIRVIEDDAGVDRDGQHFERYQLMHRALPEINLEDVDTRVELFGKTLSFPLLISSMTGGDHALVERINRHLAEAAEITGVAMGVGSQRVMFTHPAARRSFELRDVAPTALLLGNVGAVQLNYGFTDQHLNDALDVLKADGLFLHVNPLQEAIQPEGDTRFSGLTERIADVVGRIDAPLILKEVGSGLSPADIELGLKAGIRFFDLAGTGGTSWSRIEHHRRSSGQLGLRFQDWGLPTPVALEMSRPYHSQATFFASGGLRSGLDMIKSVILGARLCGLAAPFLAPAMISTEAVVQEIEVLRQEFRVAMFLLGVSTFDQLHRNEALLWRR